MSIDCERAKAHAEAVRLDNQAWGLESRLHDAYMRLSNKHPWGPPEHQALVARLMRMCRRAMDRRNRRAARMRALGMSTRDVLALQTGERVWWRDRWLKVTDWECFREPLFDAFGVRIDAEPVFRDEQRRRVVLPSLFWHELVRCDDAVQS